MKEIESPESTQKVSLCSHNIHFQTNSVLCKFAGVPHALAKLAIG